VLAAIILAAGESSRMGRPKALLAAPDGLPFVARLVRTFAAAGIPDVVVVAGADYLAIEAVLVADELGVAPRVVVNPDPSRGQLSSLWVGLDVVESLAPEAALVTLVDIPMTKVSTVRSVVAAWTKARPPISRPQFGDRHGHPVLFDRSVFAELRRAPLTEGAKAVIHAHAPQVLNVDVDDEGCVADVDTPEDYARLLKG
jgi:molybdenum cofactor cytidylyltransferase